MNEYFNRVFKRFRTFTYREKTMLLSIDYRHPLEVTVNELP